MEVKLEILYIIIQMKMLIYIELTLETILIFKHIQAIFNAWFK